MEPSFNRKHNMLLTLVITSAIASVGTVIRWLFFPEMGWRLILMSYAVTLALLPSVFYFLRWIHLRMERLMPYEKWGRKRFIVQNLLFVLIACLLSEGLLNMFKYVAAGSNLMDESIKAFAFSKYMRSISYFAYTLVVSILNLAFYSDFLFRKWQAALVEKTRLEVAAAELEREKSRVQYENLKNQLNPHFLFNSFTSLNSLITRNPTLAQRFLQQLSKVYRHLLQNGGSNLVSLQEETDFAANYIALQTTRFQQGLDINVNIPEQYAASRIVPVTLQVLIENAIKHNIIDADQPLRINICVPDGHYLCVSNNIQLKKNVEYSNKQGLGNLKRLYSYYSTQPLTVTASDGVFSVKVPLL